MGFVFAISIVILLISVIVLLEVKNITSLLNCLLISVSSIMSLTAIEAIILETIHLSSSLWLLSLFNLMIAGVIFYFKRPQMGRLKWKEYIWDLIAVISSAMACLGFITYFYTSKLNVRFETSDPVVHYFFSRKFAQTGHLMLTSTDLFPYQHLTTYPFLAYVNTGLAMKVFHFVNDVNVYMISNVFMSFITILLVYSLVKAYVKLDLFIFVSVMFLACAGYNLNAAIWGFSSQMAGIMLILSLLLVNKTLSGKVHRNIYIALVSIHIIGILFAYYYFSPVVLAGIVLYEILSKKNLKFRSIFSVENIVYCGSFFVFAYLYLIHFGSNIKNGNVSSIKEEGYIIRDLYSSFAPLLLFAVYAIFTMIKKKSYDGLLVLFGCLMVFTGVVFLMGMQGHASSYYFYKNHFLIDLILIVLYAIGLAQLRDKIKLLYISYILCILFFTFQYAWADKYINQKNNLFNLESPNYLGQVTAVNRVKLDSTEVILTRDDEKLLDMIRDHKQDYINNVDYLPVLGGNLQQLWFEAYTGIWPKYDNKSLAAIFDEQNMMDITKWEHDPYKNPYLLVIGDKGKAVFDGLADKSKYTIVTSTSDDRTVLYKYGT